MIVSRRKLLGRTAMLTGLVGLARAGLAAQTPPVCADPLALPLTQRSRRRTLSYVDVSSDPKKRCGVCAYFTAGASGCGTCQLLSGGPVNASGVCSSFAANVGKR